MQGKNSTFSFQKSDKKTPPEMKLQPRDAIALNGYGENPPNFWRMGNVHCL